MTREELREWVAALKPGDVVIHKRWNNYLSKLTVTKVTPSGIVRTEGGASFKLSNYSDNVYERGSRYGEIAPATAELLEEAERQILELEAKVQRERKVRAAVHTMSLANTENVPYEFAVDFLELCNKYGVHL